MKQDFFLLILIVTLVVAQAQFVPRSSVDGFLSLVTNRSTDLLSICDVQELSEFPSVRPKKVINGRKNETASKITIEDPPPMATFDEWTKERLKQQPRVAPIVDSNQNSGNSQAHTVRTEEVPTRREARMPNGADSHPQRNYASKECGAKALYSNPEMQNRGALLNDKERDQYMRNPCQAAQNKFVIVELCETIQATRVQIGNYELFSSGPQDFRVSVAERSPTGDWITVGDFKAADNRELQTFHVTNNGIYSKFIRIELLTHHGSEHYCTLSVLRVYGVSMVDEYEAEAVALGSATEPPPVMVSQPAKPAYKPSPVAKAEEDVDNSSDNIVNKVVVGTIGGLKSAIKTAFSWHHDEIPHVGGSFRMTMYDWCRTCGLQKARQSKWFCYVFEAYLCTSTCSISYSPRYYAESAQKRFLKIVTFSKTCKKGVVKESPKTTPPPIPAPTRFTPKGEDGSLPASSTNHKESVFLKLNKRITSLELNMSLSSEYLSELSRRYVQQTEDMRKQHDRMLENAEEAAVKTVEDIRESLTSEIKSLRVEFKSLSARLDAVQKSTVTTAEIARRAPFEGRDDFEDDFEMDQQDEQPECFSTEPSFAYGRAGNHVWTTQQMVGIIVVVQAFSLLVFYSFYAMSCPKGANIDRVEALEKKLEALIIERRPSTTNTEEINPPTITANQRKKLRKKLKQQQKALQEWDSASTATASTVTGTRCPTDRSGDENGTWRIVHRGKQKKGRN